MCTVTFIPAKDTFFITSNRDEKSGRMQAVPPMQHRYNNKCVVYPKDTEAGGSWIGLKDNGDAAVLLNGSFVKHTPAPPYRKSRGLVFLDMIMADMPVKEFLKIDLENIEPFTLVVFTNTDLYECRWDGNKKYSRQPGKDIPHIWSSATLYNAGTVKKREQWFAEWLNKNPNPEQQDILNFHRFAGDGNKQDDLLMNRNGAMHTVSITGIEINDENAVMSYHDLKTNIMYHEGLKFINNFTAW